MYLSVDFNQFRNSFFDCGRETQFSYEAQEIIFNYFDEFEQDTGEHVELDVIAICCDFTEMTEAEILENYKFDTDKHACAEDYLEYNTSVCGSFTNDAGDVVYVFQQF
jgi:hypothetical protein